MKIPSLFNILSAIRSFFRFKEPAFFVVVAIGPTALAVGFAPLVATADAISGGTESAWGRLLMGWALHAYSIAGASLLICALVSWFAERIWPTSPKERGGSEAGEKAAPPSPIPPSPVREPANMWGVRVIGQNYPILDDPSRKPTIWRDVVERQVRSGEEVVEIVVRLPPLDPTPISIAESR